MAPSDKLGEDESGAAIPDARSVLVRDAASVEELLPWADIVLDTNALLLPYRSGTDSLDRVAQLLERLKHEARLFVPAQVLREFATVRPPTLGNFFKSLSDLKSRILAPPNVSFPLLEKLPEYRQLKEKEKELQGSLNAFRDALSDVIEVTQTSWGLTDPVYDRYLDIFDEEQIIEHEQTPAQVAALAKRRYEARVPPGYKDGAKANEGLGDLSIWLSILDLARRRQRHVIFISGEEKPDWHHRGNGQPIMPRVELLDEFRRSSGGKNFRIAPLSFLIKALQPDVSERTLGLVKTAEEAERRIEELQCPDCGAVVRWSIRTEHGAAAKPKCSSCGARFHAHRINDGIVTRLPHGKRLAAIQEMEAWFHENFVDPAECVRFDSSAGGYIYSSGAPYSADAALAEEFGERYSESWIRAAAEALEEEHTDLWVRRQDYFSAG